MCVRARVCETERKIQRKEDDRWRGKGKDAKIKYTKLNKRKKGRKAERMYNKRKEEERKINKIGNTA